jgi:hypothetical protein
VKAAFLPDAESGESGITLDIAILMLFRPLPKAMTRRGFTICDSLSQLQPVPSV